MSRFFRLENPFANEASRGLDFGFGGGDGTTCCTPTSVVVSVSDLEKLLSETEGAIDLLGDSIPSGPESSTTHCQDPYSRLGRVWSSNVVVPMTILAFSPSVISTDKVGQKANLLKAVNNVMLKTSRLLISAMSSPPSLSRSQELFSSVPKLWYFWTIYCKSARTLIQPSRIVFSLACLRGGKGWDSWVSPASSRTQCNDSSSLLMVPNTPGAALPESLSVYGSSSEVLSYMTSKSSTLIGLRPQSRLCQIRRERASLIG